MACVCACLLMINYMKYYTTFAAAMELLSTLQGHQKHYWHGLLSSTGFLNLFSFTWWTFWQMVGYVIIPFFLIKYALKQNFLNMGWRFNDCALHWRGYLLLLSPILIFVVIVSQGQDFINHYPFYKLAHRSWFDFIVWEFLYLLQFVCLEFFFRGFFLNALRPAVGANAIWIMCVPYLMIHFPKLWLEATGAILFGLFLGILALRSRSIWGGFLVHAGVALSMDISSLIKQGKIPSVFWPF
ncbi:MAG: membrane protease YdiL (CAAX protease family) [Lentisphaeria bacterium]|jgi:membrane protease YdiL (CAAX protease family)